MDPNTFEQFELSSDIVDSATGFLKEGDNVTLQKFNDRLLMLNCPKTCI